jgi:antitoxin component YwqK of YwqJK toxin-antitoxin module
MDSKNGKWIKWDENGKKELEKSYNTSDISF